MQNNYLPALQLAKAALSPLDPRLVAERSGAGLVDGPAGMEWRVAIAGRVYRIPVAEPEVLDATTGDPASTPNTLVILHYLATADGTAPRKEWLPFRSLPGGNVYEQAFRQQCHVPLVAAFGDDPDGLATAAERLSGVRATMGDLSFVFPALPLIPMACVLWLGDEEQGAEVNLLFDAVAPRHLPTEDLAALGRSLAIGLVKAKGGRP